jgi:hypothetical protein
MNRNDIRLLEETRGYPCLTITLPTHRTSPDNRQDPIRVKNLVTQAADRLINEMGKREAGPLLERLDALASDIDYRYALDGLALFVSNDVAYKYYLPFTLPERVVVDESFATRNLVFAMNRTPRYWVLVLSEKPTRLYEGTRETLVEITEGTPFPMTHGGPGGGSGLPNDPAVNSSQFRDEHHRIFFRSVDEALKPLMAADPLPLAIVGVDRYLSFFNEVTSHASHLVASILGSHDKTPAHELGKLVWPDVKATLAEQRTKVFDELNAAVGGQRSASTVGEVWRFAHEGRGQTLIVEEDFHYPARVDASGIQLIPADDIEAPDVIDDAVDEIVHQVLSKGGRVVFADNGTLEKHSQIALILRY